MTLALPRHHLILVAAIGAAASCGFVAAASPMLALGLVAAAALLLLALLMPVANLTLLLLVTAIVPYSVMNSYGFGAGAGSAGLILSDVLLLTALTGSALALLRTPLDPRRLAVLSVSVIVLAILAAQALRAVLGGAPVSSAGFELRGLLGWSTLLVAVPIVADARARDRLFKGMALVGVCLGLWGIAQYFGNITLLEGGDAGVRANLEFTDAISIQGGLFGFPVAVLIASAALASVRALPRRTRALLLTIVGLNALSLFLTYERTFWFATVIGLGLLAAKAGALGRIRVLALSVGALALSVMILASAAPGALTAAQQRVLSIGEHGTGNSLRSRVEESRAVTRKIEAEPLLGWALADEIRWGMPWVQVPAGNTPFAHNGYLWLAWKLGIPAAALLVLLVAWAVVARQRSALPPLAAQVRHGAQAGLLAMLIINVMFPAFRQISATSMFGVLLALSFMPRGASPAARPQPSPEHG